MNTETRSLYKIWRTPKGRSCKRWLTDEQVAHYKATRPHWRWQKIREQTNAASLQANTGYGRYSSSKEAWGKVCTELAHNQNLLNRKHTDPSVPIISYDDILDVMLAVEKGI